MQSALQYEIFEVVFTILILSIIYRASYTDLVSNKENANVKEFINNHKY